MQNCVVTHRDGDVHIDGESMTPSKALALAFRITKAAQDAMEYRRGVLGLIAHAGEMMAHDSMRDQRADEREAL